MKAFGCLLEIGPGAQLSAPTLTASGSPRTEAGSLMMLGNVSP